MRQKSVRAAALPLLVLAASLWAGPVAAQPRPAPSRATATATAPAGLDTLTEDQLRDYLTFIASDELAGRDTPSAGLDIAAHFMATLLSRWGYEPAGDAGSYFQDIALTRRRLDATQTSLAIGSQTLTLGNHYLPSASVDATVSGAMAYVGHGYTVKSKQIDPFAHVDVRGKVVLMHPGLPEGLERHALEGPKGEDWDDGVGAAAARGAVAVLYLADFRTLAAWPRTRATLEERGALVVDAFENEAEGQRLPTATLAPTAFPAVFQGEPLSASDIHTRIATRTPAEPFALAASKQVSLTIRTEQTRAATRNVVAVLRGSDRALHDEYVAFGAHYDHVGTRPGAQGDVVYNGADDDGSGTVALLGMAEAFAKAPRRPKRSLLFVWHTGEEKGLWGSRYFAAHPTVPLDRIVTQVNVDMIGRSRASGDASAENGSLTGPDAVYVIGSRLMSTALGRLVDRVNDAFLGLEYDYGYADPKDPNQFFYRSDHYHYAKHGIPIVFYFSGVHEDYHGVDDELERIDFRKLHRIAQTIYATGWALAELPERPAVDQPLPRAVLTR